MRSCDTPTTLLILLLFQLVEKPEWPSGACKKCFDFIVAIKTFKERVTGTQVTLLNASAVVESLPPIDDDHFMDYEPLHDSLEVKREIKSEDSFLQMEPQVIIEPLPELPATRRTARVSKKRELPKDVVETVYNNSEEEEEDIKPTAAGRKKVKDEEEEANENYEQRFNPSRIQKPKKPPKEYTGIGDLDLAIRREDRLKREQKINNRSLEEKEESLRRVDESWQKKVITNPQFLPIIKEQKMTTCDVCQVDQVSLGRLFTHLERDHEVPRRRTYVVCCKRRFLSCRVLDHCKYHIDQDSFKCPEPNCGKQLMSGHLLNDHALNAHEKTETNCPECDRVFSNKHSMRSHLKNHETKKFGCDQCKKCKTRIIRWIKSNLLLLLPIPVFSTAEKLKDHVDFAHNDIPSHICDICGKGYKTYCQLNHHRKHHLKERVASQCDICLLYFLNVEEHKKNVHEQEKRPCPTCGKLYAYKYLKKHQQSHLSAEEIAIHECTVCGKKFTCRDHLQIHLNIHMGIRFTCHFCPEHYGAKRNRLKHMQTRHPEELANYRVQENLKKVEKYMPEAVPVGDPQFHSQ